MPSSIAQDSKHSLTFLKIEADFLKRLKNKRLFTTSFGSNWTQNTLSSNFQLLSNEDVVQNVLSNSFQNDFKYNLLNLYAKASYNYTLGALGINGELEVLHNNNYLENEEIKIRDNSLVINPTIGFDVSLNKNNNVTGSIALKSESPTLRNLTEQYILSDFNSLNRGSINSLEQLQSLTFFTNYTLGTILSSFYSNTTFYYQQEFEYFTSNSQITPQYTIGDQFKEKGRRFFFLKTDANIFLDFVDSNLKIKGGYTNQEYQNIVNDNIRDVRFNSYEYGMELRTAFNGPINFHIGTSWIDNRITVNETDKNIRNQSFVDVVYTPIKKVNINLNMERFNFNSISTTNSFYFADLKTSYEVFKNKLSLTVEGKNLFNVQNYNNLFINDTGFTNSSYRLLPRYVLLKARIKI